MAGPNIAVGDVLQTRVACSSLGQVGINIGHYEVTEITGPVDLGAVAASIEIAWADLYKACLHPLASFLGVGVKRLSPNLPTIEYVSQESTGAGLFTGLPMPSQVSGLISYSTNNAGKNCRGRNYIPFPSASAASADESPSATYLAFLLAVADASDNVALEMGAATASAVRIIYPGQGTPHWRVTRITAKDKWATQRRRGDYGETNSAPW